MSLIFHLPALVKMGVVFLLILVLIQRKVPLGIAFFGGGLLLGAWFGHGSDLLHSVITALAEEKTWALSGIVSLVLLFNHGLRRAGQLNQIVEAMRNLIGERTISLAIFPGLIGLLPMPGGAYFSAPMVEAAAHGLQLERARKGAINFWFRHVWEFIWPIYPGLILAASLANVPIYRIILLQIVLTPTAIYLGYRFLLPRHATNRMRGNFSKQHVLHLLRQMIPILGIVVLPLLIDPGIDLLKPVLPILRFLPKETGLLLSLAAMNFYVYFAYPHTKRAPQPFPWKQTVDLVILIVGIMAFQQILIDSRAVDLVTHEFHLLGLSNLAIVIGLPIIVGLISGFTAAFVGATYPLIIAMMGGSGTPELLIYLSLAYCTGFVAVMLSPTHLCLLLTRDHFKTSLGKMYRFILPPALLTLASAIALHFLLRLVLL